VARPSVLKKPWRKGKVFALKQHEIRIPTKAYVLAGPSWRKSAAEKVLLAVQKDSP